MMPPMLGAPVSSAIFRWFRRAVQASALLALGLSTQSCSTPQVKISILDSQDLRNQENPQTQWVEFDIFKGQCPSKTDLADGTYPQPFRQQIVDDLAGENFKTGDLATDTYGFAVLLRSDNCAIVGYGCAKADLKTVREINIKINPTYIDDQGTPVPKGACEDPQVCNGGICEDPSEG